MHRSSESVYRQCGATFLAWGGAETARSVKFHHDLGIRCTGSMWCLTAGSKKLRADARLREAVALDIEGKPIEVPWLFDGAYDGQKNWFGCTNHPTFRALNRERVSKVMAGGADGLHVDDHLGTAHAAIRYGGGLCDYCIEGFSEYLKEHAPKERLRDAGVRDLAAFDYRTVVRKFATTRRKYIEVRERIPLMDLFERFHLEAAAENVRQLGRLGAETAGHDILLSANTCLTHGPMHHTVVKHLTHMVAEIDQHAADGTAAIDDTIAAYHKARKLGKPLAATAYGEDWFEVKERKLRELVRFWIALAYAHGQSFMVPSPDRQWCFSYTAGMDWFGIPIEEVAPVYRFIRANAAELDGFEHADAPGLAAPEGVLCTVRRKGGSVVVHVLNRDYDQAADRMRPRRNVRISLPKAAGADGTRVRLLSYDAATETVPLRDAGDTLEFELPQLRLWTLAAIE